MKHNRRMNDVNNVVIVVLGKEYLICLNSTTTQLCYCAARVAILQFCAK
jgi:hypothetical protein